MRIAPVFSHSSSAISSSLPKVCFGTREPLDVTPSISKHILEINEYKKWQKNFLGLGFVGLAALAVDCYNHGLSFIDVCTYCAIEGTSGVAALINYKKWKKLLKKGED